MTDDLISHQKYRYTEPVCEIECLHCEIKHLLDTRGRECDHTIVAVRAEPALHHITLRRTGGLPGAGSAALDIDDDAGRLSHRRKTDILHHQGETGSARCGHGTCTGP